VSHTLLLADDSVTIQRVIELTFADEDIKVVAVSDGDQAIARLDAAPPDIVLADIGMPGRNGYEVAQYIKQSPKLSKIPVVLLTGAFEPVDQARAAEAGCDGILAKPFEPQLVISRVKELLASGGSAKPAAKGSVAAAPPAPAQPAPPSAPPKDQASAAYFDRLDAAFTSASAAPPAALVAASKLPKYGAPKPAPPQNQVERQDDMDLPLAPPPPAAPRSSNPPPGANAPADASDSDATRPVAVAASGSPAPSQPMNMPALADAFAALLAAEQAEPLPPSVPMWPASGPPSDAIADEVVRRVLAQLSDKVVRERVTELVSSLAEKLVREEIEKIKAAIK